MKEREVKREKFSRYIQSKGFKSTKQRDDIVDVFLSSDKHISTEDLYLKVKIKNPSIGFATVYRTLKLLTDSGIAEEINFGDGHARYEKSLSGDSHHDHLICTRCGKIEEFENHEIEKLQEEVTKKYKFKMKKHKLEIYGVCVRCNK